MCGTEEETLQEVKVAVDLWIEAGREGGRETLVENV